MNNALKDGFPPFRDEQSLRSAIELVSAKFGKMRRLIIFPASRLKNLRCACFMRMDADAAEAEMKSKLDVIDFGGDIHFFADVDEGWTGRTMSA